MGKQTTCHTCIYAHWDPGLWLRTLWSGFPAGPFCGNQPDSYGRMKECSLGRVCRNYRARPPVPQGDAVKTIPLGGGFYTYVDAADYEWLSQWRWRVYSTGYAGRYEKGKVVFMHREIMRPPKGMVVDHINGNKADNTRANLRNTTPRQNSRNKGRRIGSISLYKGVRYDKRCNRWRARIYFGKKSWSLGPFDTEVEAARAYDHKAVELFGEFAWLNFPEEWPAERRQEVRVKWLREQARQKGKASVRRVSATARTKAPAREGHKRATRDSKRVTKRAPRKTPSRVPQGERKVVR